MSDDESVSNRSMFARLWPAWVGIGLAIFIALVVLRAPWRMTPAQIERQLAGNSEIAPQFKALKAHYPADYRTLLEVVSETENAEGRLAAQRESILFMRSFLRSKVELILGAPDKELRDIASSLADALAALRDNDVGLCARFVMFGVPPGTRLPAAVTDDFSRSTALQIRAARAAERAPRAPRGFLSAADGDAFLARISARDPVTGELLRRGRLMQATPIQQCNAGISLYRTAADLPAPDGGNAIAHLIRISAHSL